MTRATAPPPPTAMPAMVPTENGRLTAAVDSSLVMVVMLLSSVLSSLVVGCSLVVVASLVVVNGSVGSVVVVDWLGPAIEISCNSCSGRTSK